jgi:hypothetical protein
VAGRRRSRTFAEILDDELSRPTSRRSAPASPGRFNRDGDLFTPDGHELGLVAVDLSAEVALACVRAGAAVAHEGCGCGGGGTCHPTWFSGDRLARAREVLPDVRGRRAPAWIDLWEWDGGLVVFVHGDVTWAGIV